MPRVKQTEREKIEADSFETQLRKRFNAGYKETTNSFQTVGVPSRRSATEAYMDKVETSSLSELPEDVNAIIYKYQGMWQVILNCAVLNVTLGCSDREPKFQDAVKSALEQYAKNKRA